MEKGEKLTFGIFIILVIVFLVLIIIAVNSVTGYINRIANFTAIGDMHTFLNTQAVLRDLVETLEGMK